MNYFSDKKKRYFQSKKLTGICWLETRAGFIETYVAIELYKCHLISNYFVHHKLNKFPHHHCAAVVSQVSDISKPQHIKPKISAWFDSSRAGWENMLFCDLRKQTVSKQHLISVLLKKSKMQ